MKISLFTETTDTTDGSTPVLGHLFYDGTCPLCCHWIRRVDSILRKRRIEAVPFPNGGSESEMKLRWHDGREFGGADAAIFLAGRIWWAWPGFLLAQLPGMRTLLAAGYRRIAARRHCGTGGACQLPQARPGVSLALGWTVTMLLVMAAIAIGSVFPTLPAWIWMWTLAGAQWLGFKVIAWTRQTRRPSWAFFLWIGMDAAAFTPNRLPKTETAPGYRNGLIGLILGLVILAEAVPRMTDPAFAGWLGMMGLIGALHFGIFDWMATIWNRLGFPVNPIMRAPWRAATLADFWGARWNRAFSDVVRIAVFRPLVRQFGTGWGTFGGFLSSGLAHELVISVPARGGYGLPTLFFLIQGVAILAERRWFPKTGIGARAFLWIVLLAPAALLFHPPFLTAVITPMMRFIHPL